MAIIEYQGKKFEVDNLGVICEDTEVKKLLCSEELWESAGTADSGDGVGDPVRLYRHKVFCIFCGGYCCPHPYSSNWEEWGYVVFWGCSPEDIIKHF